MAISENLIEDALAVAFVVSERSADALEAAVNVLEEQYEHIDVIAAANGLLASALSAMQREGGRALGVVPKEEQQSERWSVPSFRGPVR